MRAYLVRVGIDQAFGGWNAPFDPATGDFVYVPIPEAPGTRFQPRLAESYASFLAALTDFRADHPSAPPPLCVAPTTLAGLHPHLDPDFGRLTYGDDGLRRGRGLRDLGAGDLVAFYAGLRPIGPWPDPLVYAIIGIYRVAEVVRVADVPRHRWGENAHTRRLRHAPEDIVVRARPRDSGRLTRAIPIGEYRDRAYRVRRDVLHAWGDLTCKDGYIQRSAVPPAFRDPDRFLSWLARQEPVLVTENNVEPRDRR